MSTFEDLKSASKVLLQANKIPEYEKLLSAMSQLMDLQQELAVTKSLLREKQNELDRIFEDGEMIATLKRGRQH